MMFLAAVSKLMLNSLFGKFAQRVDSHVALVSNVEEMEKITNNPDHEILNLFEVGEKLRIEYKLKESMELDSETPPFYSPIIAGRVFLLLVYFLSCFFLAMITAAGRQELHKYMKMLGRRLLYGDLFFNLYDVFNMQFFFQWTLIRSGSFRALEKQES